MSQIRALLSLLSPRKKERFDDITYATVGIEPGDFYKDKFVSTPATYDFLAPPENKYDIEFDRARFLASEIVGPNVLDIGCGSGPYAGAIRAAVKPERMVGIDLDPACVETARTVYDEAFCFELGQRLPFEDATFNTVFSADVFGHIEFRYKDAAIQEIHRITAPGGKSVHIVESGFLDYRKMDAQDPDDPIRKYVWMEGHIGVETAHALEERWGKVFDSVTIHNASVYPMWPLAAYLADPDLPEDLRDIILSFDDSQKKAAQIMLGYVANKLKREAPNDALFPDHTSKDPLRRPSGLVYLVAHKRRD